MESAETVLDFSDLSALIDPEPIYENLREREPVVRARGPGGREIYVVTSRPLIEQVTRQSDIFSNKVEHLLLAGSSDDAELAAILRQEWFELAGMITKDAPEHTRKRALVNAVFATRRITEIAPKIQQLTDEIIDEFIEEGECDFVDRFAILLPTYVIADILGLPRDQYPLVREWSDAIIKIVSRMATRDEELEAARKIVDFRRFIRQAIQQRRAEPQDDLISMLINVEVPGLEPLSDDEIGPLVMEIATAGNETTRNTLIGGLNLFLRRPDQLAALAEEPGLINNAVEEVLRFVTPVTGLWRITSRETKLGGVPLPAGAEILMRFDAANRDPAMFPEPEDFDIRRKNAHNHFAFGAPGIHRCLGQMLARKEMAIAFPLLFERLRNMRALTPAQEVQPWAGIMHRGIRALRIAYDPGSRITAG